MPVHTPLVLTSRFSGGNGTSFQEIARDAWTFQPEEDLVYGPWYDIRLHEPADSARRAVIVVKGVPAVPDTLTQAIRPVVSVNGGAWQRTAPASVHIERRGRALLETPVVVFWEQGRAVPDDRREEYALANVIIRLDIPAASTVELAATYPYTYEQLCRWLATLGARSGAALVVHTCSAGPSEEGRSVPFIELNDPGGPRDEKIRVLVSARMHAGLEAAGSWGCEAIVDFLLSHPEGRALLRHCAVGMLPMVNVDGVARGRCHYNVRGVDINVDLSDRVSAEARAVYGVMQTFRPHFYLDLHGWLCHEQGRPPYDGAYFDLQHAPSRLRAFYEGLIAVLQDRVPGFASRALYQSLGPQFATTVATSAFGIPSCAVEINPSFSTIAQVQERTVGTLVAICQHLLESGLPVPR